MPTTLLWNFHVDPITTGVFQNFPIVIRATPRINRTRPLDAYVIDLVLGLKSIAIDSILAYMEIQPDLQIATRAQIAGADCFLFAFDRRNNRQLRTQSGRLKIRSITPDAIAAILAYTQSQEEREVYDMEWNLSFSPGEIRAIQTHGGSGTGPPKWLKKLLYKNTWTTWEFRGFRVNCVILNN